MQTRTGIVLAMAAVIVLLANFAWAEIYYADGDSYIKQLAPDTNYGTDSHAMVRNWEGITPDYEADYLIYFDLSSIPIGSDISSAELFLWYSNWHNTNPTGREMTLHRITSAWDELTVTWNNRPTYMAAHTSFVPLPPTVGVWITFNVTADVQLFVSALEVDNHGWQLMDLDPWGGGPGIPETTYTSRDWSDNVPYLVVDSSSGLETSTWSSIKSLFR